MTAPSRAFNALITVQALISLVRTAGAPGCQLPPTQYIAVLDKAEELVGFLEEIAARQSERLAKEGRT